MNMDATQIEGTLYLGSSVTSVGVAPTLVAQEEQGQFKNTRCERVGSPARSASDNSRRGFPWHDFPEEKVGHSTDRPWSVAKPTASDHGVDAGEQQFAARRGRPHESSVDPHLKKTGLCPTLTTRCRTNADKGAEFSPSTVLSWGVVGFGWANGLRFDCDENDERDFGVRAGRFWKAAGGLLTGDFCLSGCLAGRLAACLPPLFWQKFSACLSV